MFIIKKEIKGYTVVPNKVLSDLDDGLAVGILVFLLSRSDFPRNVISIVYSHFKNSVSEIDKAMEVLKDAGYMYKSNNDGVIWIVSDTPEPLANDVYLSQKK